MIAINVNDNTFIGSKYAARLARKTGISEDTIYKWIEKGYKVKQYKDYIYYLEGEIV